MVFFMSCPLEVLVKYTLNGHWLSFLHRRDAERQRKALGNLKASLRLCGEHTSSA